MNPDWLPPKIILNGATTQDDYSTLYAVFTRDLLNSTLSIDGYDVFLDMSKDEYLTNYERSFTHMVTRRNGSNIRVIDYKRAEKLPWVRPVIDNYQAVEVTSFWFDHPTEEVLYLWLRDYDFVVILKWLKSRSRKGKILVTAYSVDKGERRKWEGRFKKAKKIL